MLIIQSVLVFFFLFASSIKMFGWINKVFTLQLAFFKRYGLNRTAMFIVGAMEAFGALIMLSGMCIQEQLLIAIGAGFFILTSIGAMYFHFRFDTWKDAVPSIITFGLSLVVALPYISTITHS
ncbi:DoxX family protein [Shewanella maritima]|uniref:DoxX family protein n=1 Tax=Shewanella maritima TaxID=2520507 RepID=UPI003736A17B